MRIFVGLVAVHTSAGASVVNQHNEQYFDMFSNENEAIGAMGKHALSNHPGGVIAYQQAWDVTEIAVSFCERLAREAQPS